MEQKRRANLFKITLALQCPKAPPQDRVEDLNISKQFLKNVAMRRPEWDKARHHPQLHYTASRRVLATLEEQLVKKKEYAKERRVFLDNQWRDIEDKEIELRDTFIRLDSFIKTNAEKKERAAQLAVEQREVKRHWIEEVEKFTEKIARMHDTKREMDRNVRSHNVYQRFLDRVVVESNQFRNITDMIQRFELLDYTKQELGERQSAALTNLEQTKADLSKMTEGFSNKLLGLTNHLAEVNARYQKTRTTANRLEQTVYDIKRRSLVRSVELGNVKMAAWNMYEMMCGRKMEEPQLDPEDTNSQLTYIKRTLLEYEKIRKEWRNMGHQQGGKSSRFGSRKKSVTLTK